MKRKRTKPVIIVVQPAGAVLPAAPTVATGAGITGDNTEGGTLTGVPATFNGSGVAVTRSWRKNGTAVSSAATYSVFEVGDSIVFRSIGSNAGGLVYSDSDPVVIEADVIDGLSAYLRGNDRSTKELGFRDEYSLVSDEGPWTVLGTSGAISGTGAAFERLRDELDPDTEYWFRTVAYNAVGDAMNTPVANYWTPPAGAPVASVTTQSPYTQLAEWTFTGDPSHGGFRIYQSTNGTTYTAIAEVAASLREYQAISLSPDTLYYYKVRAFSSNAPLPSADGTFSNVVSATTEEALPLYPDLVESYDANHFWRLGESGDPGEDGVLDSIGSLHLSTITSPGQAYGGSPSLVASDQTNGAFRIETPASLQVAGGSFGTPITLAFAVRFFSAEDGVLVAFTTGSDAPFFGVARSSMFGTGFTDIEFDALSSNVVHHIVAVFANNDQRLYVDGVLIGSSTTAISITADTLTVGAWVNNTVPNEGVYDELAVFPSALTSGQCIALYESFTAPAP